MKVKTINRSEEAFTRERAQDVQKVHHNLDPALHPFEKAVEYTRALQAGTFQFMLTNFPRHCRCRHLSQYTHFFLLLFSTVKLDRIFAKPFVASFAHDDGVTCLARNPRRLNSLLSGSADGEIRLWDVPARRCLRRLVGHTAAVRGISITPDGEACVSASIDCTVKLWKVPFAPFDGGPIQEDSHPVLEFSGANAFLGVDHHWQRMQFVTAGAAVDLWDHTRSEPVSTFSWGSDTVTSARFNPAEPDLFATTGSDRGIALYDLRASAPVRKLMMQTKSNAVAWNPMEPLNFTVASEDSCLYTYDMRKMQSASCVHRDFVSAVMDVDYSPTGREFVAASYDRSIRIFKYNGGHSREVYHTKRMQRVFASRFSGDGSYVFSGSDDMNVRVWKAEASAQMGVQLPRERQAMQYNKALVERHKHLSEVKRINRHRQLPKPLHKATKLRKTMEDSERRKLRNKVAHSAPGSVDIKPIRKKKIVAELE
jgi:WD repeat and SOF domain-containing protein 1